MGLNIALLGSAPSSLPLAPFGDPAWKIWGCSPGVFAHAARVDAWFELHRWEPGIIGKPATQKQWFSPEYVAWMGQLQCPVYMKAPVPEIPTSVALDQGGLERDYGTFWFTSSLAPMIAMAINAIIADREARGTWNPGEDHIGLYGVDMAATEEYGFQRAGCQRLIELAESLDIEIVVPYESDLLRPMPFYGLMESEPWHIKLTARGRELSGKLAFIRNELERMKLEEAFIQGALDDHRYNITTWGGDRGPSSISPHILAHSKRVREAVAETMVPPIPAMYISAPTEAAPAAAAAQPPRKITRIRDVKAERRRR